ncbi:MAG TPA: sialate O-acetylesterase [Sediminibacterium sp.]|nr:sialate O-acetylesterase [Sediminibacterium sp.]
MKRSLSIAVWLIWAAGAQAQNALKFDPGFSSNMVLQRGEPIPVFGKADPGKRITICFAGSQKKISAGNDGKWSCFFPKQSANPVPQAIWATDGTDTCRIQNILIGDVWVCTGQSNMEFPLIRESSYKKTIERAANPFIRIKNNSFAGKYIYGIPYPDSIRQRLNRTAFYQGQWEISDTNTVKQMSAVAWYFAETVTRQVSIPVGIINLAIGGAPIETFISCEAFAASPQFAGKINAGWLNNPLLPEWCRERARVNLGKDLPAGIDSIGPDHAYKPGFAFDAGIRPMLKFAIKGILWYQGESNALELSRVEEYASLMQLLVADYRSHWHNKKLPFYWVQLSSIDTLHYQSKYWPLFRNEQRQLLADIKYGGMAVSSDIGARDNVHPANKSDVGKRLAFWALHDLYHLALIPSGPLPVKAAYKKGMIVISFRYTGQQLATADGSLLHGFSIDGVQETAAFCTGKRVSIPATKKPAMVYYGWQPFSSGNLMNTYSLPASTFACKVK